MNQMTLARALAMASIVSEKTFREVVRVRPLAPSLTTRAVANIKRVPYTGMNRQQRRAMAREVSS